MADEMVTRAASMRDNSPLADRPEWTKAFTICQALPHIYIGRSIRVNKKTLAKTLIEKGRLP